MIFSSSPFIINSDGLGGIGPAVIKSSPGNSDVLIQLLIFFTDQQSAHSPNVFHSKSKMNFGFPHI